MSTPRIGRQTPTLSAVLPYKESLGAEAVDLYNRERPHRTGLAGAHDGGHHGTRCLRQMAAYEIRMVDPPELTAELFNKIKGHSTLAKLSASEVGRFGGVWKCS